MNRILNPHASCPMYWKKLCHIDEQMQDYIDAGMSLTQQKERSQPGGETRLHGIGIKPIHCPRFPLGVLSGIAVVLMTSEFSCNISGSNMVLKTT